MKCSINLHHCFSTSSLWLQLTCRCFEQNKEKNRRKNLSKTKNRRKEKGRKLQKNTHAKQARAEILIYQTSDTINSVSLEINQKKIFRRHNVVVGAMLNSQYYTPSSNYKLNCIVAVYMHKL
eukprot:m.259024 g.259024  ORF g.259024 m.259024 type:complete len:122 (-) comp16200_c0_seq12:2793-3158(-)